MTFPPSGEVDGFQKRSFTSADLINPKIFEIKKHEKSWELMVCLKFKKIGELGSKTPKDNLKIEINVRVKNQITVCFVSNEFKLASSK